LAYCTASDVRTISGLTTSDISDNDLTTLISYATAQLNKDIQKYHYDEKVLYIDTEKENKIDGENTTFYTRNTWIGDYNNDGTIDGNDIYAYTVDSEGTRTEYTVSSINDSRIGKFTLSEAPSNTEVLYITYCSSPVDMETPHFLVKLACCQFAAALAYSSFEVKKVSKFRVGKIAVVEQSKAYAYFMGEYYRTVNAIRTRDFGVIEGDKVL